MERDRGMETYKEEETDCPVCCNELDLTDRSIQYCECGCKSLNRELDSN